MQNLELLFEGTYQQLLQLGDETGACQDQLLFMRARLAAGTRLLLLLLRLRYASAPIERNLIWRPSARPAVNTSRHQQSTLSPLLPPCRSRPALDPLLGLSNRFALSPEDAGVLETHLSPLVDETPDMGWEERTDAAITHLLKTSLAKDRGMRYATSSPLPRPVT